MKKILEKYSKYLPSKKFTYLIAIVLGLFIILFLIFNFSPQKKFFFFGDKPNGLQNENLTINNILQQDTDNDGLADWEEALWGTDKNNKTTNGIPDLAYVENRKKELKIDETTTNTQELTETEKFAREFFATYVAMKEAGGDTTAINNFAATLGEKMVYPSIIDSYSEKNIKITQEDTDDDSIIYYLSLKILFEKYKLTGMGNELSMVAGTLNTSEDKKTSEEKAKLTTVADSYQDFAKRMIEIPVPQNLVTSHLKIANAANNTGISIMGMTKIISDPLVGLSSLSQYQEYNKEFIDASQELTKTIKIIEQRMLIEEDQKENQEGPTL